MADPPLPDGTYEAFVVDAGDAGPTGEVPLDLTIVAGEHKGEVLALSAAGLGADPLDLIGMPATLVVEGGRPRVTIDT